VNEWMAPYWSDTVTDKTILDPLTAGLALITFALSVRGVSAAYLIIGGWDYRYHCVLVLR
jgi:hypothetical protein